MGRISTTAKPTVTHVRGHEVLPESVLRRRKTQAEVKEKREEILAAQRVKRTNKPAAGVLFKKAAAFVKDYRQKFASGTRLARESKKLRSVGSGDVEARLVCAGVPGCSLCQSRAMTELRIVGKIHAAPQPCGLASFSTRLARACREAQRNR